MLSAFWQIGVESSRMLSYVRVKNLAGNVTRYIAQVRTFRPLSCLWNRYRPVTGLYVGISHVVTGIYYQGQLPCFTSSDMKPLLRVI
jgi:hypothetical protein